MKTTNCINRAIELEQSGKQLSDRVKTKVIEFTLGRNSWARRGQPRIKVGTTLYAIEYELGGYFTYSYLTREAAEQSRQIQIDNQTNTFQFYGFNVKDTTDELLPVSR